MTGTTQPDPAREWAEAWLEDHPDARPADVQRAVGVVYGKDEADRVSAVFREPLTRSDIPGGRGLNADHLPFLARLIDVADQAGVTVVYCCLNADWSIMTSPELDDEAGAAFLAGLGIGEAGEPEQKTSRTIRAGRPFTGDGVCLYVRPVPTEDATEAAP